MYPFKHVALGIAAAGFVAGSLATLAPADAKTANVLSYWGVEDIGGAVARFIELGAAPDSDPVNVGGDIMVASVKDPWGNVIGLIYNPEFKLP